MKKKLQELKQEFLNFPTKENEYEIDGNKYIVISHFVGNKDINKVMLNLASEQAYKELNL